MGSHPKAARGRSQHRNRADVAGLQLAGDGGGGAQGHQPGLLHGATTAADVDGDAGLIKGFAAARVDVHEHLADRAAGGGGGHGGKAKNTAPAPRRSGRARAPQALASALARLWW